MNQDYTENRKVVYSLEYVKSEMELKMHQFRIQNPNADITELQSKIDRIKSAQDYIYKTYELMEALKKDMQILKASNSSIQAELNHIKNNSL